MRLRMSAGCIALSVSFVCGKVAAADTEERRSCVDLAIVDVDPAKLEWGYWVLGGAVHRSETGSFRPTVGLGSELTVPMAQFVGFPAGYGPLAGRAEVRAGVWGAALLRGEAELIEGGVKLHLGGVYEPNQWGTFDARIGAGSGVQMSNRLAYGSVSLLWGLRLVPARKTARSYCAPVTRPKIFAESSVIRLFVTGRRAFDAPDIREIAVGVEMSPSILWSAFD